MLESSPRLCVDRDCSHRELSSTRRADAPQPVRDAGRNYPFERALWTKRRRLLGPNLLTQHVGQPQLRLKGNEGVFSVSDRWLSDVAP